MIATGKRIGLPVYTLGLGTEEEIESGDLRRLASSTRGQYYPARNADELRAIYEQIAERYRIELFDDVSERSQDRRRHAAAGSNRLSRQQDGSRRDGRFSFPAWWFPSGGWSPLFLLLLLLLGGLIVLPSKIARLRELIGIFGEIVAAENRSGRQGISPLGGGIVVNVAVSLAVADAFHQRGDGVPKVQGNRLAGGGGRIGGGLL